MITVHGSSLHALSAYSRHSDDMQMKAKDIKCCNTERFLNGKHTQTVTSVELMIKTIIRNHGWTSLLGLVCDNKDARVEHTLEGLFFSLICEQLFWQHTVSIVSDPWDSLFRHSHIVTWTHTDNSTWVNHKKRQIFAENHQKQSHSITVTVTVNES